MFTREPNIKSRFFKHIQSLPVVWYQSNWIGMALPVLEHNFYPPFDAYGVQTFDLILVCDLPFTQTLIIRGTVRVAANPYHQFLLKISHSLKLKKK